MIFLVLPAVYALTSNRNKKTYQELLTVILQLATDRKRTLVVRQIVSDYEEAWLRAVEKMVSNTHLDKDARSNTYFNENIFIYLVAKCTETWVLVPLHPSLLSKYPAAWA